MEAFALFANAKHLGKNAATILTVSILYQLSKKFRQTKEKER
jgi:purine-nucleoside phosphorylase